METKRLDEIRQIKKSVEHELLSKNGVTGVEVGYKVVDGRQTNEIAIRVHVKKKKDVPKDQTIPPIIHGVKTDVIQREYTPQPARIRLEDVKIQADTGIYDPLTGGISIGPCRAIGSPPSVYAGTLGTLVIDNVTNAPMMLSNYHVLAVDLSGWSVGDDISQPSLVDGGSCPANTVGQLQRAILGDTSEGSVDCAIASLGSGPGGAPRGVICQVVEFQPGVPGNISGIFNATPVLNMPVRKRGRTTGLTFGFIEAIDQVITVDYGLDIGPRTLTNQFGIAPDTSQNPIFSDHGDSGSIVVDNDVAVLGLLFAGTPDGHSSANHIQAVFDALNVTICSNVPMATKGADLYAMNIKAEAMNIKAEAMNIKAEAMNIKAEAMNIKAEALKTFLTASR